MKRDRDVHSHGGWAWLLAAVCGPCTEFLRRNRLDTVEKVQTRTSVVGSTTIGTRLLLTDTKRAWHKKKSSWYGTSFIQPALVCSVLCLQSKIH